MSAEDLAPTAKPRTAKRGRRADPAPSRELTTIGLEDSNHRSLPPDPPAAAGAAPIIANSEKSGPPRPSKRGGWGEESTSRRSRVPEEDERLQINPKRNRDEDADSDNDIPIIPDLDDNQEDDLTVQIALAPSNLSVNRVATYRELDNDLLRHAAFLTLDNETDLKLLAKGLLAESEVIDEDRQWDWDRLFTEVASELTNEWEEAKQVEIDTGA